MVTYHAPFLTSQSSLFQAVLLLQSLPPAKHLALHSSRRILAILHGSERKPAGLNQRRLRPAQHQQLIILRLISCSLQRNNVVIRSFPTQKCGHNSQLRAWVVTRDGSMSNRSFNDHANCDKFSCLQRVCSLVHSCRE